jgi:hypothetical protein
MSAVMMWMLIGNIGVVMRAPGGEQCTGKEKQPKFFFSKAEQKKSAHIEMTVWAAERLRNFFARPNRCDCSIGV